MIWTIQAKVTKNEMQALAIPTDVALLLEAELVKQYFMCNKVPKDVQT